MGKTIFTCVYIGKIFSRTSGPIPIKFDTNHPTYVAEREFKFVGI
jgi:hypothetical protein